MGWGHVADTVLIHNLPIYNRDLLHMRGNGGHDLDIPAIVLAKMGEQLMAALHTYRQFKVVKTTDDGVLTCGPDPEDADGEPIRNVKLIHYGAPDCSTIDIGLSPDGYTTIAVPSIYEGIIPINHHTYSDDTMSVSFPTERICAPYIRVLL